MNISFYLFDGVTAMDAIGPYESLSRLPRVNITFVAREAGEVKTGDNFLKLIADLSIYDMPQCDLIIIPGGKEEALRAEIQDAKLHERLRELDQGTVWTSSVCTGTLILGAAGILKGREASTHWNARDYLDRFGVKYSGKRVTLDGKYITSAGVSSGIDMGLQLCELVDSRYLAEAVELSMEYAPEPPFGTGRIEDATEELIERVRTQLRI